jgi:hypothetical protein
MKYGAKKENLSSKYRRQGYFGAMDQIAQPASENGFSFGDPFAV